ncbi:Panacea domain-containing protein [Arcanobacterium haemolyticum]|uniref:Uncharacterized phage-associated protein n=1 Tax=Arcanobacterium haemolyticum (strain ATCC 9345 / DSM 20595 / CCM 5947 / CCUG 17215 / LMG 16163 / NBRC 15585 / NCTC 8452 / 11018) TaxID=644284 RepID=D7BMR3_ARCHD|nr:type II toxin-antitoxin system antitoxin SocA domain-containing protein [Arcanobacterium haemolyticum]ADH92212.1 Uncharacterized phage-associated protein [Arcanobacterium haemolyticum DSM 20595]SQH29077.1 Uncharacterized phage-associated protein [Arcanobacterium haemolyticum]
MILSPDVSHNVDPASVANYILHLDTQREDSDVTQMKLHKLLYLAQAHYLAVTGYRLMDSDVEAFEHGPVIKAVFPMFREYGREVIVNHRPLCLVTCPKMSKISSSNSGIFIRITLQVTFASLLTIKIRGRIITSRTLGTS